MATIILHGMDFFYQFWTVDQPRIIPVKFEEITFSGLEKDFI